MSKAHPPAPPTEGVTVRMYRQGLGDCFLLTFPTTSGHPLFVLIDCGLILGTPDPETVMTAVARDIQEVTGGRLDVLVVTHEHWDHVSGFLQARDVFKEMEVDEVWLAWTEDPGHALARRLKEERRRALRALQGAVNHLRAADGDPAVADRFEHVLGFFGGLAANGAARTEDALTFLSGHGKTVRFCRPGEPPLALPGVPGVSVFVLGPPEDRAAIKKTNPSKRDRETYDVTAALTGEDAFLAAVSHRADANLTKLSAAEREVFDLSFPFDHGLKIPVNDAKEDEFFQQHYGFRRGGADAWRRIDDDWLGAAGPLALQLDNATNNTSLALAIELSPGGKVLLFPGDAQVGNWLSWGKCSWSLPEGGQKRPVTCTDLLARTVLYKVGHHASHNATLRAQGLELMTSPELVAMIPVDHGMAVKKRWDMPFPALLQRLREKTGGRVLRIDTGLEARPRHVPAKQWQAFRSRVTETELYLDYEVTP